LDAAAPQPSPQPDDAASVPQALGARIRIERAKTGMSIRELARRVKLSHSLISQIERGHVTPSVATLWSIATVLDLAVADLFTEAEASRRAGGALSPARPGTSAPIQHHENRAGITLAGGVRWERLTPAYDHEVDFVHVVYPVGSASCEEDALIRHGGREFGYVISGRLGIRIGFEEFELGPDDSISFESLTPHRLWTIGNEPVRAIWMVLNRRDDPRSGSGPSSLHAAVRATGARRAISQSRPRPSPT
jgi:transcriptional regulator with XRE-family HTH domain